MLWAMVSEIKQSSRGVLGPPSEAGGFQHEALAYHEAVQTPSVSISKLPSFAPDLLIRGGRSSSEEYGSPPSVRGVGKHQSSPIRLF